MLKSELRFLFDLVTPAFFPGAEDSDQTEILVDTLQISETGTCENLFEAKILFKF